jgi:hypothetical protein
MSRLCEWLFSLDPATRAAIIGAIIGAAATVGSVAIAFVGVVLTIRSNRVRAREDHLITLRRESFLEACDVSAEAAHFLATLPDPNVTQASGSAIMTKFSGVIGKLHILADKTTLQAVMNHYNAFFDAYTEAAKVKHAFEMNAREIANAYEKLARLTDMSAQERTALHTLISQLSQDNLSSAVELWTHFVDSKIVDKLVEGSTEVTLAFRKDLNLPLDEKWYRKTQEKNLRLTKERWKPSLDSLRERLAKLSESRPQSGSS